VGRILPAASQGMEAIPEIKGPKIFGERKPCMTRKEVGAQARELNKREPKWFCS